MNPQKQIEALNADAIVVTKERDDLKSTVAEQTDTLQGTGKKSAELQSQIDALRTSLDVAMKERDAAIEAAKQDIAPFSNATVEYGKNVEDMQQITKSSKMNWSNATARKSPICKKISMA